MCVYSNLQKTRIEKKVSQGDCAKLLGVQGPAYCKKELGIVKFTVEEAKILSEFFEKPVEFLFFRQENS